MTTRAFSGFITLATLVCSANAVEKTADLTLTPEAQVIELPCVAESAEPIVVVCPGLDGSGETAVKPEVDLTEVFVGVVEEGTDTGTGVVVGGEVDAEVVKCGVDDVRHYTGSEVERGGSDVDPVIFYTMGASPLSDTGTTGAAGPLGVSSSGIEAADSLRVNVADAPIATREVKVTYLAGDVIISD